MICANLCFSQVVSFKDAAKIKSWDAWNDHKKQTGSEAAEGIAGLAADLQTIDYKICWEK